jgi:tRNA (cytidine/uridine-2'-O-)-methyltransferase
VSYEPCLHIVLYQPEIPYNTGSVGRTCVAIGAKLWLVRPLGFRLDDYYLRRAGLDYWERLQWEAVDDWQALVGRLPPREPWLFTKTAPRRYTEPRYQPGDILMFGSESQGLPPLLLDKLAERTLRIPIRPQVRSLNLSNSVAIAAYEAIRQGVPPAIEIDNEH